MNDNETVFERMKEDMRLIAKRALTDMGNDFETVSDNMQVALDVVLNEMRDKIYK